MYSQSQLSYFTKYRELSLAETQIDKVSFNTSTQYEIHLLEIKAAKANTGLYSQTQKKASI